MPNYSAGKRLSNISKLSGRPHKAWLPLPSSHRIVELMDVFIGCGKVQDVGRSR